MEVSGSESRDEPSVSYEPCLTRYFANSVSWPSNSLGIRIFFATILMSTDSTLSIVPTKHVSAMSHSMSSSSTLRTLASLRRVTWLAIVSDVMAPGPPWFWRPSSWALRRTISAKRYPFLGRCLSAPHGGFFPRVLLRFHEMCAQCHLLRSFVTHCVGAKIPKVCVRMMVGAYELCSLRQTERCTTLTGASCAWSSTHILLSKCGALELWVCRGVQLVPLFVLVTLLPCVARWKHVHNLELASRDGASATRIERGWWWRW